MDEQMTHDIPSEFTDEDRWFKFFTKKQAALIGLIAVLTVLLFKFFEIFGLSVIAIVIGVLMELIAIGLMKFKVPVQNFIRGGGQSFGDIALKRLARWINRCIYVKGYCEERGKAGWWRLV